MLDVRTIAAIVQRDWFLVAGVNAQLGPGRAFGFHLFLLFDNQCHSTVQADFQNALVLWNVGVG